MDQSASAKENSSTPLPSVAAAAGCRGPDATEILKSIGEAAYEWQIDTDSLIWGANAAEVLGISEIGSIASGCAYAARVEAGPGSSRFDAVTRSNQRDEGGGIFFQAQYAFRPPDSDAAVWLEDTGRWFAGPDGQPLRAHGVVRVITERHQREEHLTQRARYDALTGELNREYMTEILEATLQEAVRFRASCGFLLIAIDNLERLNVSYGYDVADQVIAQVTRRIRQQMRNGDHIGRFSGNKFGVILKKCTPDEMTMAAERFLACIRDEAFQTSAGSVAITISIGAVTAPRHARDVHDIMARAQDALGETRNRSRETFVAYRPNVEREAGRRESVRVTDEAIAALNERRVSLAFEPVADALSRKTMFYECLMRLEQADGTMVHSSDIIPIAERVGLIRMLDFRALELAIGELAAAPGLHASVNVSAASTADRGWWDGLGAMARANPGVAERLTVEITETAMIHNVDDMCGFIHRVKDLGCHIAIDDFGAGYTSFRNLRKLGVDIVKIDGALVRAMAASTDDFAFVQTLIDLSRRLGIQAVAEWVQDERTARMLIELGCHYLQGELIGLASPHRPWLPADAARALTSA